MSRDITMLPQYSTMTFTEIWDNAGDFKTDFQAGPFAGCIHYGEAKPSPEQGNYDDDVSLVYYLLYARYGNSPIANRDINQFKFKIYSVIFQYGPTWEKRLEVQKKLRELNEEELRTGAKAIYNAAFNPSTAPATSSLEELEYINQQNTTGYKKSKLEAYSILWEALKSDVTGEFIKKFENCFKKFVRPEHPLLYITDEVEEDEGE